MSDRPEIDDAVRENRDLTESERLSFGLDEMAANVRHWLKWTKDQRDKEGLDCGEYADVHFPVRPSYPMFVKWAETLEAAATEMRKLREPVTFTTSDHLGPPLRCTVQGPQHIVVERVCF
jgi:hypothetical protein